MTKKEFELIARQWDGGQSNGGVDDKSVKTVNEISPDDTGNVDVNVRKRFDITSSYLYFSFKNGDDNNDGITPDRPKKNLNEFLNLINGAELYSENGFPRLELAVLDHDGSAISLQGISGGYLLITGAEKAIPVERLSIRNCNNYLKFHSFDTRAENWFINCGNLFLRYIRSGSLGGTSFYFAGGTKAFLDECLSTNSKHCIKATENSEVTTYKFKGEASIIGVEAVYGSRVRVNGDPITGEESNTNVYYAGNVTYF